MIMRIGQPSTRLCVLLELGVGEEAVDDADGPRRRPPSHGAVSDLHFSLGGVQVGWWAGRDPGDVFGGLSGRILHFFFSFLLLFFFKKKKKRTSSEW